MRGGERASGRGRRGLRAVPAGHWGVRCSPCDGSPAGRGGRDAQKGAGPIDWLVVSGFLLQKLRTSCQGPRAAGSAVTTGLPDLHSPHSLTQCRARKVAPASSTWRKLEAQELRTRTSPPRGGSWALNPVYTAALVWGAAVPSHLPESRDRLSWSAGPLDLLTFSFPPFSVNCRALWVQLFPVSKVEIVRGGVVRAPPVPLAPLQLLNSLGRGGQCPRAPE